MTGQLRLPIFVDCPYGGCEDGYCACLEQDLDDLDPEDCDDLHDDSDPDELDEETRRQLDELDAGRAVIYRGCFRPITTIHLPDPAQGP
ncbi:hypothetical protein WB388_08895 [Streptomyces brasiliscabiei]|uniref:Cysteine-rich CPCC domain-containing protein n=1 Tax=Streptomyces brasiliscabiei TaxID=2736302 RepID=A0ABU8GC80_9ACTN